MSHPLHGLRDLDQIGNFEGTNKTRTHTETKGQKIWGLDGFDSLLEVPQYYINLECLLYTFEQRDSSIQMDKKESYYI